MTDYAVRLADLERDRDAIVALWARNLQTHDARTHGAKYDWYYRDNPLGPGRLAVIETTPGGPIVGTAGLGWRRLSVGGETVLAALASDFAVDPDHRSLGPAMMLQRSVLEVLEGDGGAGLIYGMPNAKALPIFKRLGYQTDGTMTRYVKVLGVERYLKSGPQLARRVMAGIVDPVLRVASPETWRPRRGREFVELRDFDKRFDELWERSAGAFPVAGERTSEFLRWRYGRCPLLRYTTLGLIEGGRLAGYVVCKRGATDQQVTVIDLWCGADESTRDDLIARFLSWARSTGAASVACELAGSGHLRDGLARFGFRQRGTGSAIAISAPRAGSPKAELPSWYFMQADEDYN